MTEIGFNFRMGKGVIIGTEVTIGNNVVIGDNVTIGNFSVIENAVEIGYSKLTKKKEYFSDLPTTIGENCIIRSGAIIYKTCQIGDRSWIGNYTIIRENTIIGHDTTIGAHVMCEGYTTIGNEVKIYSFVELGGNMIIGDKVFIGPGVVTANNPRPVINALTNYRWNDGEQRVSDCGPIIHRGAKIGIGAILLAEIEIGCDALVAAGALVNRNVPPYAVVRGVPAKVVGEVPEYERTEE